MAEANGDDVSNILNTPVKDYADNFSKEMSFTKGLPKYLTYFVLFMFAIFTIQISLKMTLPNIRIYFKYNLYLRNKCCRAIILIKSYYEIWRC